MVTFQKIYVRIFSCERTLSLYIYIYLYENIMEIANVFPRPISSMNHPQILIVRSLSTAKYLKFSVYLKTNMFSKGFLVHIGNCKTLL